MTLKEFMEKQDMEVLAEASKCQSAEELKGVLLKHKISLSKDETAKLYAFLSKAQITKLSDEDLDAIAGGGWYYPISGCPNGHTKRVAYWDAVLFRVSQFGIVDDRCRKCDFLQVAEKGAVTRLYCSKQGGAVWEDGLW